MSVSQAPAAGAPIITDGTGTARPNSRIFDIPIDLGRPEELLRMVTGWVGSGRQRRVMYVNAHVLNQSQERPELRTTLQDADLVYCDGYGVRIAAKAMDLPTPHRMTGADWIWTLAALCEESQRSIYLLGSEPGVTRAAAVRLQRWYPRLQIAGSHHGFFAIGSPHADRVVEDINERQPDIVLVGMGTPKQENWVREYSRHLDTDVLWTVGALFDYVSGRVPRAPGWLADNGLEWIFRLGVEPQRMWRRYLLGNPMFLSRVMAEDATAVTSRLLKYSYLFEQMVRRELRSKYKGSALGVLWYLVNPLVLMAVYAVMFRYLLKAVVIDDYPLFLFIGLIVWTFFSQSLLASATSLVDQASLVSKVRFPRETVPAAVVSVQLVPFAALMVIAVAVSLPVRGTLDWPLLLLVPVVACLYFFALGLALLVSVAHAYFRDVQPVLGAALLPWFFVTPIFFRVQDLPGLAGHPTAEWLLRWANPVAPFIDAVRSILYAGAWPGVATVAYVAGATLIAVFGGLAVFRRAEAELAVVL